MLPSGTSESASTMSLGSRGGRAKRLKGRMFDVVIGRKSRMRAWEARRSAQAAKSRLSTTWNVDARLMTKSRTTNWQSSAEIQGLGMVNWTC